MDIYAHIPHIYTHRVRDTDVEVYVNNIILFKNCENM